MRYHLTANFVAPVNVIDCSDEVAQNPDFLLTADHVTDWEARHGPIKTGEWVVMRSDWYHRNTDEARFLNVDETGPHSPGPSVLWHWCLPVRGAL